MILRAPPLPHATRIALQMIRLPHIPALQIKAHALKRPNLGRLKRLTGIMPQPNGVPQLIATGLYAEAQMLQSGHGVNDGKHTVAQLPAAGDDARVEAGTDEVGRGEDLEVARLQLGEQARAEAPQGGRVRRGVRGVEGEVEDAALAEDLQELAPDLVRDAAEAAEDVGPLGVEEGVERGT